MQKINFFKNGHNTHEYQMQISENFIDNLFGYRLNSPFVYINLGLNTYLSTKCVNLQCVLVANQWHMDLCLNLRTIMHCTVIYKTVLKVKWPAFLKLYIFYIVKHLTAKVFLDCTKKPLNWHYIRESKTVLFSERTIHFHMKS